MLAWIRDSEVLWGPHDDEDSDKLSQLDELSDTPVSQQNRKKGNNAVPRLVDQQRKHLERNMPSAQRDLLLINEAKKDPKFRKYLSEVMWESLKDIKADFLCLVFSKGVLVAYIFYCINQCIYMWYIWYESYFCPNHGLCYVNHFHLLKLKHGRINDVIIVST